MAISEPESPCHELNPSITSKLDSFIWAAKPRKTLAIPYSIFPPSIVMCLYLKARQVLLHPRQECIKILFLLCINSEKGEQGHYWETSSPESLPGQKSCNTHLELTA